MRMIDFTPSQRKTVAAAITVLAFSFIVVFVLTVGWIVAKFLSLTSAAITPVIVGLFLALLFKPYYEWIRSKCRNPTLSLALMLLSVLLPLGLVIGFGGSFVVGQAMNLLKHAPTIVARTSKWVNEMFPNVWGTLQQFGADPEGPLALFFTNPARFSDEGIKMISGQYGGVAMKAGVSAIKYVIGLASWLITLVFFVFFLMRPSMKGKDYVRQLPFLKDQTKDFVAKQIDAFTDILVNFFQACSTSCRSSARCCVCPSSCPSPTSATAEACCGSSGRSPCGSRASSSTVTSSRRRSRARRRGSATRA